jgi:hypothetical protein
MYIVGKVSAAWWRVAVVDGRRGKASVGRLRCVDVGRERPYRKACRVLELRIF